MLMVENVTKAYGGTRAVSDASLSVPDGEALGLVGHNGAGKSTLMKVVAGLVVPDTGTVSVDGVTLPMAFGVQRAREAGIRLASQEVVLCADLLVLENAALAHPELMGQARNWRRQTARLFDEQLRTVFPTRSLSAWRRTNTLSLTELQVVQLTIATMSTGRTMRALVLDEPTSALTSDLAQQLFSYVRRLRTAEGTGIVIISHKMDDIIDNTEKVLVMRDGKVAAELASMSTTTAQVVQAMGGSHGTGARNKQATAAEHLEPELAGSSDRALLRLRQGDKSLVPSFHVFPGEIVGLAGLEGQGQQELLDDIWRCSRRTRSLWPGKRRWEALRFRAAYVSGDRQQFGLLPLWEARRNITIASLGRLGRFGVLSAKREHAAAQAWVDRARVREGTERSVLELSGGTQQKVLLARGMAAQPQVLLLDDPFRGVDVMTKEAAYEWVRQEARQGQAVVWYSSENAEFKACDRVYVMRGGTIAAELVGGDITDEALVRLSFEVVEGTDSPVPVAG